MLLVAIDDNRQSLDLISATLEQPGLEIVTCADPGDGLEIVRRRRPRIVLLDLMMPGMSGMDVLDEIVKFDPSIEVILVTAHYSTESAVQAIQRGASDYLEKPFSVERLRERVGRIIADTRLRDRAGEIGGELNDNFQFNGIIGRSAAMLDLFARIRRIGPHFRTVLVTGPTGSGKELVARALHQLSPVAGGPFVVCNCAAIAENLVESELFGHVKGAFTGAVQDRPGMFEYANNGTLLLDEIGEMPLQAQAKLLRAVQNQEIQRVGSPSTKKVTVRVIAATHRDLRAMVKARTFREDLFFRLGIIEVRLPPLNDRREDVALLTRHFMEHYCMLYGKKPMTLTRRAEALLARHDWTGNVRELEGMVAYSTMMAEGDAVDVGDFPDSLRSPSDANGSSSDLRLSLAEMQVVHTRRVVESLGGNKKLAAEVLGVSRATLYRLLAGKHESSNEE